MDALSDGLAFLPALISNIMNYVVVPLWNLLIGFIQAPFGKGPYATYSLPIASFELLVILIMIGWKFKASIDPLNDIIEEITYYSAKGVKTSYNYAKKSTQKKKKRRN